MNMSELPYVGNGNYIGDVVLHQGNKRTYLRPSGSWVKDIDELILADVVCFEVYKIETTETEEL